MKKKLMKKGGSKIYEKPQITTRATSFATC
jgi:hypothetical protein